MDGASMVEEIMKLGLTGASILANVLLYKRMDKAETMYDELQKTERAKTDAMLTKLLEGDRGTH